MSDHPVRDEMRLTDGAFYAGDPHRSFHWMREHAPVYWDASGQVWGVARFADVMAVSVLYNETAPEAVADLVHAFKEPEQ